MPLFSQPLCRMLFWNLLEKNECRSPQRILPTHKHGRFHLLFFSDSSNSNFYRKFWFYAIPAIPFLWFWFYAVQVQISYSFMQFLWFFDSIQFISKFNEVSCGAIILVPKTNAVPWGSKCAVLCSFAVVILCGSLILYSFFQILCGFVRCNYFGSKNQCSSIRFKMCRSMWFYSGQNNITAINRACPHVAILLSWLVDMSC